MNQKQSSFLLILPLLLLMLSVTSCDAWEDVDIDQAPDGDYFPLVTGTGWEYGLRYKCYYPDAESVCEWPGTEVLAVEKDTVVDGLTYYKMNDYIEFQRLVRKEDNRYYYRDLNWTYGTVGGTDEAPVYGYTYALSEEVLFLDTSKPVTASWTHTTTMRWGATQITTYVVKAIEPERTIDGVRYENIIEVEEQVQYISEQDDFYRAYSNIQVYAKGVGRVYSFYPFPPRYMTDVALTLQKFCQ